ncbi:MAG TPA: response regulator [Cyanobacteria bacterium UBA11369]|nr:response regulator [Cyanobacteria bacterium UBA11371]HBE32382.1 response regulator [Cyanobacteria bacterium UBA11368]HBE47562.1 response regulator [Cyanobacteria bacterium UBA11369]
MTKSVQLNGNGEKIAVLLIEDDPGDADLIAIVFQRQRETIQLKIVHDGEEAIAYLRQKAHEVLPHLILLDLNLPGKSGREVLQAIKSDEQLKQIPVVILTGLKAPEEVLTSYKLGANAYLTKPGGLAEFTNVIQSIDNFWLTFVHLPPDLS